MKRSQLKPIIREILKEIIQGHLPPETTTDNYELFTKMLQGSGYDIPSKEEIAKEIARFPLSTRNATWKQLAKRWLDMYSDFAQYGTD